MHTIEFYENEKGKSEIIEYIRLLHEGYKDDYYKIAAFLDVLAEKGSCVDKEVCRCPEGIIYMHNIGMTKLLSESFADLRHGCVGRPVFRGKRRFFSNAAHRETAVCVIVYGQYLQGEKNRESFVVLHHYFTNRVYKGLPLLQIYFAVRRLRQFIKYRNRS